MGVGRAGGQHFETLNSKLHIGFAAQGGAGWAGGVEYIRNLARAVREAQPGARIALFCGEHHAQDWEPSRELFDAVVPVAVRRRGGIMEVWRGRNREFRRAIEGSGCDFLYPLTYDNAYNLGVTFPIGALPCAWAGWIPDFQHRHLPQLFSEKEIKKRDAGIAALAQEARTIVLSSESAAEDFRKFYPAHAAKARVLTFGTFPNAAWYEDFTDEDLAWLPRRYFAVCNQFWSHKNHGVIFRALELLAREGIRPSVVCTGALVDYRQPDHAERLLQQAHRAGIGAQVMLLGLVPRRLQIEIVRRSLAVLQPSLFEGWSTIVEDARVLGKATLLSDLPVHREQNPPGAQFFPPTDAEALARLLAAGWATLEPGPHREAEQPARRAAEARIRAIGERLVAIAEETIGR